jgi:hypothetical protein
MVSVVTEPLLSGYLQSRPQIPSKRTSAYCASPSHALQLVVEMGNLQTAVDSPVAANKHATSTRFFDNDPSHPYNYHAMQIMNAVATTYTIYVL